MDTPSLASAKQALEAAIRAAGSQGAFAARITRPGRVIKQQNVSWWLKESGGKVPDYAVLPIEEEFQVSRHLLRPDIFGAPPKVFGPEPAFADRRTGPEDRRIGPHDRRQ
jgi:hypothetical protein